MKIRNVLNFSDISSCRIHFVEKLIWGKVGLNSSFKVSVFEIAMKAEKSFQMYKLVKSYFTFFNTVS